MATPENRVSTSSPRFKDAIGANRRAVARDDVVAARASNVALSEMEGGDALNREPPMYSEERNQQVIDDNHISAVLQAQEARKEAVMPEMQERMVEETLIAEEEDFTQIRHIMAQNNPDKTANRKRAIDEKAERDRQYVRDSINQMWENNTEVANTQDLVDVSQAQNEVIDSNSVSPTGDERSVIEALEPIEDTDENIATRAARVSRSNTEALRRAASNDLYEMWNSSTKWDVFKDAVGFIAPFRETAAQVEIVQGFNDLELGQSKSTLHGVLGVYYKMDTARKMEYRTQILDIIQRASGSELLGTDNTLRAMMFYDQFMNPNLSSAQMEANLGLVLDLGFSAFDAFAAVKFLSRISKYAGKMTNAAKQARILGNEDTANDLDAAALKYPEIARTLGIEPQEAANQALPFNLNETINPGHTNRASTGISIKLDTIQRTADKIVKTFKEDMEGMLFGAVSRVERQYQEEREIAKLEGFAEDYVISQGLLADGIEIVAEVGEDVGIAIKSNIQVQKRGHKRTEISFDIVDAETGEVLRKNDSHTITWGLDKASSTFTETVAGYDPNKWWLASPSVWAQIARGNKEVMTDFFDSFRNASRMEEISAKAKSDLTKLMNTAIDPVRGNRKAAERVQQILEDGDMYDNGRNAIKGKVYNLQELKDGVHTASFGTVALRTDEEIEAYYAYRRVSDELWGLQNEATRKSLQLKGYKGLVVQGQEQAARPFETLAHASSSIGGFSNIRILSLDGQEVVNWSADMLREGYENGQQLVKFQSPFQILDGTSGNMGQESVRYAMVHPDSITNLPVQVIHYKVGYVPKINKGVEYLLKRKTAAGMLDGNSWDNPKTLRMYGSKKQADADLDAMFARKVENTKKYREASPLKQQSMRKAFFKDFEVVPDRNLTDDQMLSEPSGSSGGLFTGQRSSSEIYYGPEKALVDEVRPDRFSPFEAMQRQTAHVANYVTKNEWRQGEQQRWLNTVREVFPDLRLEGYAATNPPQGSKGDALRAMKRQIDLWSSAPSVHETGFQRMVQQFHDRLLEATNSKFQKLGKQSESSIPSLLWLKHFDLASASKAAVFHTSLGMLNPVQLYVQAQAAVVALSRATFKEGGMRTLLTGGALAMSENIKNPAALAKFLKAQSGQFPDIEEVHRAWRLSGLAESIKTNADITAMSSGVGSSLKGFMSNIADGGLVFYRQGEMFNRGASFTQAFREWKTLNPTKFPNAEDLADIGLQARQSMLELGRSNAARWQGGPDAAFFEATLSVMFQFAQVGAKTLEKTFLIGADKGLNAHTKGRIFLGQAAFFGLAGVPMGSAAISAFNEWTGTDAQNQPEWMRHAWNGGMTHVMMNYWFGANSEFASRGSLASGIDDLISHVITGGDNFTLAEATPAISMASRIPELATGGMDAAQGLAGMLWPVAVKSDREMSKEEFVLGVQKIAEFTTTGRSFVRYWIMKNHHKLMDRKGNTLVAKDFSASEEMWSAFGMKNSDEVAARDLQFDGMDIQAQATEMKDSLMAILHDSYVVNGGAKDSRHLYMLIQEFYADMDPAMAFAVRKLIDAEIKEGGSLLGAQLKDKFARDKVSFFNNLARPIPTTFGRALDRDQPIPPKPTELNPTDFKEI